MEPFSVTRAAAAEVRRSIELSDADGMGLRIAVRAMPDGSFDYIMGFDERAPGDLVITTGGVEVLIGDDQRSALEGAMLDFVELEPGAYNFIFSNPNDPAHGNADGATPGSGQGPGDGVDSSA